MKVGRKRIAYLVEKTIAGGATAYYWQPDAKLRAADWMPLALGTDLSSAVKAAEARNAEVKLWRGGGITVPAKPALPKLPTVDQVIALYQADGYPRIKQGRRKGDDRGVSAATRKQYDSKFREISRWAGPDPIAAIEPANVEIFRDALLAPTADGIERWHHAHETLRVLRTLCTYATKKRIDGAPILDRNPAEKFDLGAPPPRHQVWSAAARAAIEAAAVKAGEPSLALAIALAPYFSQRQGDMLRMTIKQWQAIPPHRLTPADYAQLAAPGLSPDGTVWGFTLRQRKTNRWVEVPIAGDLRTTIEAEIAKRAAGGVTTLLVEDTSGLPWDRKNGQTYFQRRFAELRATTATAARDAGNVDLAAELEGLQFRDYRRTGVVMLGELGIAPQLIGAITGHSLDETEEILETYMPRTTAMAGAAIATLHARAAVK